MIDIAQLKMFRPLSISPISVIRDLCNRKRALIGTYFLT